MVTQDKSCKSSVKNKTKERKKIRNGNCCQLKPLEIMLSLRGDRKTTGI
jgi:hypothetical protein